MSTDPDSLDDKHLYVQLFTVNVDTQETHMRIWGPLDIGEYLDLEASVADKRGDVPDQEVILPAENAAEVHDFVVEKHVILGREDGETEDARPEQGH